MKLAAFVLLGALTGWVLRGMHFEDLPPIPKPIQHVTMHPDDSPMPSAIQRVPLRETSLGQRNLFAYRVHETRPIPVPPVAVAATVPPSLIEEPAPIQQPTPFPYRYLGTFGTSRTRVAAFKRDHEIITVREGDRIGEFILRSIGIESADVEGPDGIQRVVPQ